MLDPRAGQGSCGVQRGGEIVPLVHHERCCEKSTLWIAYWLRFSSTVRWVEGSLSA
jgi:hypothetical protein